MNIFKKTLKKFGFEKLISDGSFENDTADNKPGVFTFESSSSGVNKEPPSRKASESLKEMKGWVFACVNAIAEKVADTQWKLYKYNTKGEVEEVFEHPVLDSLYKVNEFATKFDHFWLTTASLELTGEAPWYLEKDDKGKILGIYVLRPDRISIVFDADKLIAGYEYTIKNGGKSEIILLAPDEVIFLKYTNPDNPYRGLGTLSAVARTVDIENYAERWNEKFFYNSARPDGLLTIKVKRLTEEQKKKIKASIREYYQGVDNAHKLMVLSGDMDYKQFSLSQKDMDFMAQQNFSRNKILGIFRVPKVIVSQTDEVNYCYSEDTEVLTENGFKKYWEVGKEEKIATVNQKTNVMEYCLPKEKFVYDYDGKMIYLKTKNTDALITPNHKIWYRTEKVKDYKLEEVENVNDVVIKTKASVEYDSGIALGEFIIPKVERKIGANNNTLSGPVKIEGDTFIEYLGYFLSEGGMLKETSPNFRYVHTLCQKKSEENISKIRKCVSKTGFSFTEYEIETGAIYWNVYGKAVNSWLRENCGDGCDTKKIPLQFKNLNKKQLRILFDALMLGDGSWDKRENRNSGYYATTSKQLADDVQELALKLGYSVLLTVQCDKRENRKTLYLIHICERKENNLRDYKNEINYNGKVWCFEVPNHLFITRRNGKISIFGNSNAKTAERIFTLYTIKPKLQRITEQLNEFFVSLFPDGDSLFLDYVSPVPEELDDKIKRYKSGLGENIPYLTINEVRELENLAPLDGDVGDQIYIPAGLVPIGKVGQIKKDLYSKSSNTLKSFRARTKPTRELDGMRINIRKIVKEKLKESRSIKKPKKKIKTLDFDLEQKELFWNKQIKIADKFEEKFKDAMDRLFERQKKQVVASVVLEDGKKGAGIKKKSLLNKAKEQVIGVLIFNPLMKDVVKQEGQIASNLIDKELLFDVDSPVVRDFIKNRPKNFLGDITETTNERIKKEIQEGIKKGEGIDKIKNRIGLLFDNFKDYRSERIARSEVIRASSFATEQSYIQSGVVEGKEWLVSFDNRTCSSCEAMNGKIVGLGKNFFDKGDSFSGLDFTYEDIEYPPLHCSCRCTLIPVIIK